MEIQDALAHVSASSAQLTTWALAICGGTIALIVGTSYRRPKHLGWRLIFLLFLPGWVFTALSLDAGNELASAYLASLMVRPGVISEIASDVNDLYANQRDWLFIGLSFFGAWLAIYLFAWVFGAELHKEK